MIWDRETEAGAHVGPGRPAAQKAVDKTTAGFAGWSARVTRWFQIVRS
jgi:hypothetical protein